MRDLFESRGKLVSCYSPPVEPSVTSPCKDHESVQTRIDHNMSMTTNVLNSSYNIHKTVASSATLHQSRNDDFVTYLILLPCVAITWGALAYWYDQEYNCPGKPKNGFACCTAAAVDLVYSHCRNTNNLLLSRYSNILE